MTAQVSIGAAIRQALSIRGWTTAELSARSSVTTDRLDALADDTGPPISAAELENIADACGPVLGPRLVRAWLLRQCPEPYRDLVAERPRYPWYRRWAITAAGVLGVLLIVIVVQLVRYSEHPMPGGAIVIFDRLTGTSRLVFPN
jgi:hypothetical protein